MAKPTPPTLASTPMSCRAGRRRKRAGEHAGRQRWRRHRRPWVFSTLRDIGGLSGTRNVQAGGRDGPAAAVVRPGSGVRGCRTGRRTARAAPAFCTLPMALRGSSSTKSTRLRLLEAGEASATKRGELRLVGRRCPGAARRRPTTPSPKSGCGTPITADSATPGSASITRLDLLRVDVVAAGDDQVLAAADDATGSRPRRSRRGRR